MDYNAQPWIYEVVAIEKDGKRTVIEARDERDTIAIHNMLCITPTTKHIFRIKSRKGMVKGQYEI